MSGVYLSLGAGVQSSVLALLADTDRLPTPVAAIFADTRWEPPHVYDTLEYLQDRLSYPVEVVSAGSLPDDMIHGMATGERWVSVPFFTRPDGMMRRQCTNEYKIRPVHKKIRELEGLRPRQRYPKTRPPVTMWMGLTWDEMERMKTTQDHWWVQLGYPLIDLKLRRSDMADLWADLAPGAPQPGKSACIGCPYHTKANWIALDEAYPHLVHDTAGIEEVLQGYSRQAGVHEPYMHRDRIPLLEAIDKSRQQQVLDLGDAAPCDSGWCFQ